LGIRVPRNPEQTRLCQALSLFPRPLILGQGPYEERNHLADWNGSSLAWIPGIVSNVDTPGVQDLLPNRAVDLYEEVEGFDFFEVPSPLNGDDYEKEYHRRQLFRRLPSLDGLMQWSLKVPSLMSLSNNVVQSVQKLGCLWFWGRHNIPERNRWEEYPTFANVHSLSVKVWDFFCGSAVWPVSQDCWSAGSCRSTHAIELGSFLCKLFPSVRSVDFFFRFTSQDPPKPSQFLTHMMRALIQTMEAKLSEPLHSSVHVIWLWDADFDNLDNIDLVCAEHHRRRLVERHFSSRDGTIAMSSVCTDGHRQA